MTDAAVSRAQGPVRARARRAAARCPAALLLLGDRRLSDRARCSGTACTASTRRTRRRASSGSGSRTTLRAFDDDRFWHSTWNTVLYIVVTVPGALVVGLGLALLANKPFKVKWPVRLGLLLPWALPLVFAGPHLPLVLRVQHRRRQQLAGRARHRAAATGCRVPRSRSAAISHRDRLEGVVVHGADAARRPADDSEVALRGRRGRRRVEVAAVRRDHAADAAAGDLRRADLPHDHRDPDVRHSRTR